MYRKCKGEYMIVCLTRFVLRSSSAGQGILFFVDLMILSFQSSPYVLCSLGFP